jgi:hypothetical protein
LIGPIGSRGAAETDHTAAREQHVYQLSRSTPALRRVLPRCYGMFNDAATGEHAIFLELVADAARLDATGAQADWPPEAIDEALTAAAGWHAWRRRHAIIETLPDWHAAKERCPATLVHDDFNERNVGFRPGVVVLDWELAQCNIAQRDLVELLTFVLPASADRAQIDGHVEAHRTALMRADAVVGMERDAWIEGFRCELKIEAIDRLGLQFLCAAQFPLAYLVRINATIERLLDLYG